jgi:Phosphotransferase enzyme family
LLGGIANAGAVSRVGRYVLRPASPYSDSVQRFLRQLREAGYRGAPAPAGRARDGRERLEFIAGDVAIPPYPAWAQTDAALASVATLMRKFHGVAATVGLCAEAWNSELADHAGGALICHNDVCFENVVFHDGVATALLDFDFAAPGRPVYDLAQMARMCVPIDDEVSAARLGWRTIGRPARLRLVADTYGLDGPGRTTLLDLVDESVARHGELVLRRVERGDANFIEMWNRGGGMERYDRRRKWWHENRHEFQSALG